MTGVGTSFTGRRGPDRDAAAAVGLRSGTANERKERKFLRDPCVMDFEVQGKRVLPGTSGRRPASVLSRRRSALFVNFSGIVAGTAASASAGTLNARSAVGGFRHWHDRRSSRPR